MLTSQQFLHALSASFMNPKACMQRSNLHAAGRQHGYREAAERHLTCSKRLAAAVLTLSGLWFCRRVRGPGLPQPERNARSCCAGMRSCWAPWCRTNSARCCPTHGWRPRTPTTPSGCSASRRSSSAPWGALSPSCCGPTARENCTDVLHPTVPLSITKRPCEYLGGLLEIRRATAHQIALNH